MEKRRLVVSVLAALAVTAVTVNLSACGGGGGGNGMIKPGTVAPPVSPPPPPPPPVSPPPPPPPPPAYDSAFNHLIPTGAQAAQQAGFTGQGISVGILDSGVDPTAPPMNGRIAWFKSYLSGGSQSPNDTSGHGTVVADILGGTAAGTVADTLTGGTEPFPGGVAPGAGLYFEQVCTSAGTGSCSISSTNYSDFVTHGVRIVNGSFGSGDAQTEFTGPADPNIAATQAVFQPAVNAGILQVWAAGSAPPGSPGAPQPWDEAGLPYWIPSFQPNWLAVVGVAINSNGQPDGLYAGSDAPSNACGVAAEWCLSAPASVEFPGVPGLFSSGSAHGTSASAAIVSGVAAQVLQAFPWMTAPNLTDTILTTATPLDDGSHTTPNPTYGWGMVNAAKAVQGPAQFAFGNFDSNIPSGTTATFANDISGSGSLTLSGAGTLVLTGNNAYSGGTTISAGALQIGNGGTSGSIAGDVTDNGALVFDRSDAVTYGGVISGTGSLTQAGTGTLTLTGANTYTGGTNINSGVLQVSSDANLGGGFAISINNGTLRAGASFTLEHTIAVGNVATVDTNGYALTLDGISGSAVGVHSGQGTLVKQGAGTLTMTILTGNSWGSTSIDAGTLAFSIPLTLTGPVSIASGATFDVSQFPGAAGDSAVPALTGNGTVALGSNTLDFVGGSASWTFGGTITDGGIAGGTGGGLNFYGSNTTATLTGANTYTGTTTIENGTLALSGSGSIADSGLVVVGDAGNSGTLDISGTTNGATIKSLSGGVMGPGAVVLGGKTLTVSDGGGFGGVISGTGGLVLLGGTFALSNANTYTGGTTIGVGATLNLGNYGDPTNGSIMGDVVDNGSLVFSHPLDQTFGGVISGTGSVAANGYGTLTLTGANTFSGGVDIGSGVLAISNNANLGATSGGIAFSAAGTLETTASFSLVHNVDMGISGGILITDAGTTLTVPNPISGSGLLIKRGGGTLLMPESNAYLGEIAVSAGTLTVDGSVGSGGPAGPVAVEVNANGTLNGVGTIESDVTNSGTVISQGTQAGQGLTIDGDFTASAGSTTAIALGDPLKVTGGGTASLSGTMEVLAPPSGYTVKSTENLITAGSISGTFANLTFGSGVFYTGTLAYTPTQVNVNLTQTNVTAAAYAAGIIAPAAVSAAQRVQGGFDSINTTVASGGTPSLGVLQGAGAIQNSATPAVAQATLTSLSGQLHAASAAMLFDGIDAGNNALSEHFDNLLSGRARPGIWSGSLGWQGDLQRSGYSGASFRSDGGMVGADMYAGTHALLGFAAGQSMGFGQLDSAWDRDRTWMNNMALYGGLMHGPWYASAQVSSGWYREDMQRLLQLGALQAPVGSGFTGRYTAGALEGGRLLRIGAVQVTPFADVRYQRLNMGGFAEQGGLGYGLKANARAEGRLQTGLGLRAERDWRLANGMRMAWYGSAGWQHTLHEYGNVFDASFTGFNDWLPVDGIGLSHNVTVLRAGLSLWPSRNFGLRLGYTGEQGERQRADNVMLQGTVKF